MSKVRKPAIVIPLLLTVILLGGAIRLQDEIMYKRRQEPLSFRDTLYLPDSRYIQFVSVGYSNFAADFLWLRMIQSYAAGWSRPENKAQMKAYFDVITDLDPHYIDAYDFAVLAIGDTNNESGDFNNLLLDIVDKANLYNPRSYKEAQEGAFYSWWKMKNAELGKYYVQVAMKDPGHPDYIDRWPVYFDLESGRFRAAFEQYMYDYQQALTQNDEVKTGILARSLKRNVNLWISDAIKEHAVAYNKEHGHYPTIEELEKSGEFKGVELPNWPFIQNFFDQIIQKKVVPPANFKEMDSVVAASLKKWDRIPPSPFDDLSPEVQGYVIWTSKPASDENFVLAKVAAVNVDHFRQAELTNKALSYKATHKDRIPQKLEDFAPEAVNETDAFGGHWTWDPKTLIGNTALPNLNNYNFPEVK